MNNNETKKIRPILDKLGSLIDELDKATGKDHSLLTAENIQQIRAAAIADERTKILAKAKKLRDAGGDLQYNELEDICKGQESRPSHAQTLTIEERHVQFDYDQAQALAENVKHQALTSLFAELEELNGHDLSKKVLTKEETLNELHKQLENWQKHPYYKNPDKAAELIDGAPISAHIDYVKEQIAETEKKPQWDDEFIPETVLIINIEDYQALKKKHGIA